jgi:uncharacterized protein YraI
VAQVFAVYYAPTQEPWLQIDYGGTPGWISATQVSAEGDCGTLPEVIVTGQPAIPVTLPPELGTPTPIPPPPTPTLTPTPSPLPPPDATATATFQACMVAPTDDPGVNLAVYDGPSTTASVLGSVGIGEYLPATGIYYPPNYDTWVQVQFRGMEGWIQALYWMFDGNGCWPLPQVTLSAPPPTWTANPWTPTLLPTSTLAPEVDVNHVLYVRGDVGWTDQFTGVLPNAEGGTVEFVGIRVNEIPVGEVRLLNILVQCTGANPQRLRWGYYGSAAEWECGRYIDTGVSQGGNLVMLALTIPNDGTVQVTYTITATVNAVP